MVLQRLKREGSTDDVWTADPETGLFTRNFGVADAGLLDFNVTGNVNDLNEATAPGITEAYHLRLNPTGGNWYVAGMQAGVDGQHKKITNVSNTQTLQFFNGAVAAAANQWRTPRLLPFYLYPWQQMDCQYDGTIDKWLCLLSFTTPVVLPVAVPALATAELGYVDVNVGGTFAGVTAGDPIIVAPQADVAAAGVGNGGFINARLSALNTCRLAFIGATPAGNVNFLFAFPL
jgi:hypothetical protein